MIDKQKKSEEAAPAALPEIDRCIQTGVYEKLFSTAACIAAVGGKVFHRGVYGQPSHPPPVRKVDFDILYDLGSLTQPLGPGLAALWLVGKGRMDLGAPLNKSVPELRDERFSKVTLDMLLDHSSGLPAARPLWQDILALDVRRSPTERVAGTTRAYVDLKHLVVKLPFACAPGTRSVESELNPLVLGWAVESVTGQSLDVFLEREIYRPLGLAETLFFVRQGNYQQQRILARKVFAAGAMCPARKRVVQGEVSDPLAWISGGVAGHAGLFGTVDAVWQLVHALWASHRGTSSFFLGGTVKRFWTRSRRAGKSVHALAWQTPTVNDSPSGKRFSQSSVGHVGSTGGAIWIDLSTDVTGVFLANANHPNSDNKAAGLMKLQARLFELIAKHGETLVPSTMTQGSRAFYEPAKKPTGRGLSGPPRGPKR